MPLFQAKTGILCRFFNAKLGIYAVFSKGIDKKCRFLKVFCTTTRGRRRDASFPWMGKY